MDIHDINLPVISGAKGSKGGGAASAAKEDPNTLRSRATVKVLDFISQGEIGGLYDRVNPLKSVYFDDTAIQAEDGTFNFANVIMSERVGTAGQPVVAGFPQANSPVTVGVVLEGPTNYVSLLGTPVVRTVNAGYHAAVVTILVAGLNKIDKETGDIHGTSVAFLIERRIVGGAWQIAYDSVIQGKTMTPYERDYRVDRPQGVTDLQQWELRVTRRTPKATESNITNGTSWSRYVAVKDVQLSYPNWAYVALAADAESTGGAIPKRSYDIKGLLVKVPTNYDPETRVYNGIWNGTFKMAWTDNPAWCIYDMLTNARYGMGEFVKESQLDKFSFYRAAVYNDQLVTYKYTNSIGNEVVSNAPRFRMNLPISTQIDAWKLIQSMASNCQSFVGEAAGMICLIQDSPKDPVKNVTRANVIDGKFSYASTSMLARHNRVNITFTDAEDNYLPHTVTEEMPASIAKYGLNSQDVVAYGVVHEAQARRAARSILETENTANRVITYSASWDHIDTVPGDIVNVLDPTITGYEWGGRIAAATTNEVTLDRDVDFSLPGQYSIVMTLSDGSLLGGDATQPIVILSHKVVNGVTVVTVPNLAALPPVEAVWMIKGPVQPQQYRIVAQKEDSPGIFTITGLLHDPSKYGRIEQNVTQLPPVYYLQDSGPPALPTNLTVAEESYTDKTGTRRRLRLTWATRATDFITRHAVKWSQDSKGFNSVLDISQPEFLLDNAPPGSYTFLVTTYNVVGVASPTAQVTYTFVTGENGTADPVGSNLKAPINLGAVNGATRGNTFYTQNVEVAWDDAPDNLNLLNGVTQPTDHFLIEYLTLDNFVFKREETKQTRSELLYTENSRLNGGVPLSSFKVRVYAVDGTGKKSPAATATLSNPVVLAPINVGIGATAPRGLIFVDQDVDIYWDNPSGNVNAASGANLVQSYEIQFYDATTNALFFKDTSLTNHYVFTLAKNTALGGGTPRGKFKVIVRAVDNFGKFSEPSPIVTLTEPVVYPPINVGVDQKNTTVRSTTFWTRDVRLAWDADPRNFSGTLSTVKEYVVQFKNASNVIFLTASANDLFYVLTYAQNAAKNAGIAQGDFFAIVYARSVFGTMSTFGTQVTMQVYRLGAPVSLNVDGTEWKTPDLSLNWAPVTPTTIGTTLDQIQLDIFKGYQINVKNTETNASRYLTEVQDNKFVYPFDLNKAHSGSLPADPTLTVTAQAINVFNVGNSSITSSVLVAVAPPSTTSLTALPDGGTTFNTQDLSYTWSSLFYGAQFENSPMFLGYRVTAAAANLPDNNHVRTATTVNITLSGLSNVGGATISSGDWILVKNQSVASSNGIYQAAVGVWARVANFNDPGEFTRALFKVDAGTLAGSSWIVSNTVPEVGVSPINFTRYDTAVNNRIRMVPSNIDTYLHSQNKEDNGGLAAREVRIQVSAVDVFERTGGVASASFLNPAPAAPGVTTQNGYYTTFFTLVPPNDPDVVGYIVRMSELNGVGPYERPVVYDGSDPFFNVAVEPGKTYYYTAACYDMFGKQQVNWTSQRSFASLAAITTPEFVYTGVNALPVGNTLTWSTGTATNSDTGTSVNLLGGSAAWAGGVMYLYHVWPETTLRTSTSLAQVFSADNTTLLASYRGGNLIKGENGAAYMDGGFIIGQTIGAAQLVTNQAVITGTAQIANGVITEAAIGNAQITDAKIAVATIDTLRLKNGAITILSPKALSIYTSGAFVPANQTLDTGWQEVGFIEIVNPSTPNLMGNALAVVNGSVKVQAGSNSNSAFYKDDGTDRAGTTAWRVSLFALDQNDGIWYRQTSNFGFDTLRNGGETTGPWSSDQRITFNHTLVFQTVQYAVSGSAGTETINQGSFYRPNQKFRLVLEVRLSVYKDIYFKDNFTAPSGIGSITNPGLGSTPYQWLYKLSGGAIASTIKNADVAPPFRVENATMVVSQILK